MRLVHCVPLTLHNMCSCHPTPGAPPPAHPSHTADPTGKCLPSPWDQSLLLQSCKASTCWHQNTLKLVSPDAPPALVHDHPWGARAMPCHASLHCACVQLLDACDQ